MKLHCPLVSIGLSMLLGACGQAPERSQLNAATSSTIPSYALRHHDEVPDDCQRVTEQVYQTYIYDIDEEAIDLAWTLDCHDASEGGAKFDLEINLTDKADGTVFTAYLKAHQGLEPWGSKLFFGKITKYELSLVIESGLVSTEGGWQFQKLHDHEYRASFDRYTDYRNFYQQMVRNFWFAGSSAFLEYLHDLWGEPEAGIYKETIFPKVNAVLTRIQVTAELAEGEKIPSLIHHDVMRDCRTRESGFCL